MMTRTIKLTPVSATGWTNSERAILEPRSDAGFAGTSVATGQKSDPLRIALESTQGQRHGVVQKATVTAWVNLNGTNGQIEYIALAGFKFGQGTPGPSTAYTPISFTVTGLQGRPVGDVAAGGLEVVTARIGGKFSTHRVAFVEVSLECTGLGGNPLFTTTLGDIRTQVAQTIGRAPSDLAVIAAQTEIAEAMQIPLPALADGDSNRVLDSFPALYAYGILAHHAALIRDEQAAAIWRGTFEAEKRRARASLFAEAEARRALPPMRAPGATP